VDLPTWWLDELAHAGDEHLDTEYVAGYERKSAYAPAEDIEALRGYGLDGQSSVIDFGAGTGVFAMAIARHCREVIAVEIAPAMVAAIQQRIQESGIENVRAVQAGLLSYEHHGQPVDFVFSRNVLHHLPDFWKSQALVRIARLLKPGGVLSMSDVTVEERPRTLREAAAGLLLLAGTGALLSISKDRSGIEPRPDFLLSIDESPGSLYAATIWLFGTALMPACRKALASLSSHGDW
jgi:2-polyprenyl-3-methyl-5-hydroxy-6-metoxy-1,4-benzoquinol methylase